MYLQFNFVLSDVSDFLVDGDYHWSTTPGEIVDQQVYNSFLPVVDKCGIVLKLQQVSIYIGFFLFNWSIAEILNCLKFCSIFYLDPVRKSSLSINKTCCTVALVGFSFLTSSIPPVTASCKDLSGWR